MSGRRAKVRRLPERSLPEVLDAFPHLRQSLLAEFDSCALMTRFGLETTGYYNAQQARGVLFHRVAAKVLQTLRETGEVRMPVEEALQILYEVCAQRDVPAEEVMVVPAPERRLLRICTVQLVARNTFRMERLIDVERRLHAFVEYPHPDTGEVVPRSITGQPDALVADPPDGIVVLDWKTTLQPPPEYHGDQEDTASGVSYMGYFQQRVYALLTMDNYPSVQRCTMREYYPLANEARLATVTRDRIEDVRRELAAVAEMLDRALRGGSGSPIWQPSPGKHCGYCPRPGSCPIPEEERGEGAITSRAAAERFAAQFVVADRVRSHRLDALKAWVEVHGPVPVKAAKGRYEMRWKENQTGRGKRFGMHVPEVSDRGPEDPDLAAAFDEAAERRAAA